MLIAPLLDSPALISFSQDLGLEQPVRRVRCEPIPGQVPGDCFRTVEQHAAHAGGQVSLGWAIWEWPGVFIEAEFHAVWHSPAGQMLDLAARQPPQVEITFQPDPHRHYQGKQVDNLRKALVRDKHLDRLFELAEQRFDLLNTPDLEHQHGLIALSPRRAGQIKRIDKDLRRLQQRLRIRYP